MAVLAGGLAALPWALDTDTSWAGLAGMIALTGMLFGPVLGPVAVLKGTSDLRQLHSLAVATAPGVVPNYWAQKSLALLNSGAGLSLGLLSCAAWFYAVAGPVL